MDDALEFPFPEPPEPGRLRPVAPGVFWLRMPLPFKLDHINLWLLEDGDGWTAVDAGFPSDETRALWGQLLAGDAAGRPVKRLIVTHFHPDHFGLSDMFTEEFGLPLLMTREEWLTGRLLSLTSDEEYVEGQGALFRKHGLAEDRLATLRQVGNAYAKRVGGRLPSRYHRIRDGETLEIGGRAWHVVVGHGHAPEHATLYCDSLGVLISGDQILPKISPNISSVWFEPDADPLGEYLNALAGFRPLPRTTLVLPSHRLPFHGLHQRLDSLAAHHEERLERIRTAVAEATMSAFELLPHLFKIKLDTHHLTFAMGEAIAHCEYLAQRGDINRFTAEGVVRYTAVKRLTAQAFRL